MFLPIQFPAKPTPPKFGYIAERAIYEARARHRIAVKRRARRIWARAMLRRYAARMTSGLQGLRWHDRRRQRACDGPGH